MKQKDILLLVMVGIVTAIIAFVFSTLIFKVPPNRSTKVPVAGKVDTTFPDIRHDSSYNAIFNKQSLDPAVPVQVGSSNNQPFAGSQ